MRTKRWALARVLGGVGASLTVASALAAQQREPYTSTLQFGTGLIDIPVAWVSPNNSDVWLQTSGKYINYFPDPDAANFATKINSNISIDTHWLGRFSLGASAYSQNPEWGFFGQVMLWKSGAVRSWVPAVAVGFRNLGKFNHEDRLLIGHDISLDPADSTYKEISPNKRFKTAPTVYGVATSGFALRSISGSVSLGYGNGLFKDDGGLGKLYNDKGGMSGVFYGVRAAYHPTLNTTLTFLAENNAWDFNAGVVYDWRGITLGVYGTELEEGGRDTVRFGSFGRVYNNSKFNVSLGYSGNIIDISRGVILRTRITDLTREQQRLRNEILARERRIRTLEVQLRRSQAGELAELVRKRQELEKQITDEREQIQRAMDALRRMEEGQRNPPPTTPPPTTPPTRPPEQL